MNVIEAINERQSIRDYRDSPVPEDKLKRVLEAGRMAPSGGNRQEFKFVVVRDKETRARFAEASGGQRHVGQAPVLIAAVATITDRIMLCGVPAYPVDVAIAVWDWGTYLGAEALTKGIDVCISTWNRPAPNTLPAMVAVAS